MFDTTPSSGGAPPLQGVRVVDAATIYAGPMIATLLGDFGADVIKVEHPKGDGLRQWEWRKDGESLWWAVVGRNKRDISLALSDPRGAEVMRTLLAEADVFIENFRPGTLERWGLAPQDLLEINPKLVIVRVSGFGQTGPYRSRPGFGTIAEAMSGFADTNGAADGPPVLPQWPLADGVTSLAGAFATMVALRHAEATGQGQVVDLSIYEPLFWILGAQTSAYDQLGTLPSRQGSRTGFNVPARVLPDPRRPVDRVVGSHHVHRATHHACRRPTGSGRRGLVHRHRGTDRAPGRDRRGHRLLGGAA
jgi:crotonobetainyl-CoA:carnitine CoA-transferase CaiB-like acyl-CoA transferase